MNKKPHNLTKLLKLLSGLMTPKNKIKTIISFFFNYFKSKIIL